MASYKSGSVFFLLQSPDRNPANKVTGHTKTSEMNPRPKLLRVEGIQKRKNPDKNYVSKLIYSPHFIVLLIFMTYVPHAVNSRCSIAKTSKLLTSGVKFCPQGLYSQSGVVRWKH